MNKITMDIKKISPQNKKTEVKNHKTHKTESSLQSSNKQNQQNRINKIKQIYICPSDSSNRKSHWSRNWTLFKSTHRHRHPTTSITTSLHQLPTLQRRNQSARQPRRRERPSQLPCHRLFRRIPARGPHWRDRENRALLDSRGRLRLDQELVRGRQPIPRDDRRLCLAKLVGFRVG